VEQRHHVTDIHATAPHPPGLDPRRLEVVRQKRWALAFGKAIKPIIARGGDLFALILTLVRGRRHHVQPHAGTPAASFTPGSCPVHRRWLVGDPDGGGAAPEASNREGRSGRRKESGGHPEDNRPRLG
jgi:hypothetical protein